MLCLMAGMDSAQIDFSLFSKIYPVFEDLIVARILGILKRSDCRSLPIIDLQLSSIHLTYQFFGYSFSELSCVLLTFFFI